MPPQLLHILTDTLHLLVYADILRTMRLTLAAAYTVVSLPHARYGTVKAYQVITAQAEIPFPLLRTLLSPGLFIVIRQGVVIAALVIVGEYTRNVNAIRTRHTVFTVIARYSVYLHQFLRHLRLQILHLPIRERCQRTV